jgi:prevent-host-death family protein
MAKSIAVSQLKTHCLRLVEEVAQHRREFVVTKRGKPMARLVPTSIPEREDPFARLRGTLIGGERVEDFDTGAKWDAARRR